MSFYATSDAETFKKLAGSFDLIISTVGVAMDFTPYLFLLKKDGTMVLVGAPEGNSNLSSFAVILGRKSLAGSMIGSIQETQEMLDFCGQHDIVSDIEVTPIDKVNEAYERMLKSDVPVPLRHRPRHAVRGFSGKEKGPLARPPFVGWLNL